MRHYWAVNNDGYINGLREYFPETHNRVKWHREQQQINTINRLKNEGLVGVRLMQVCRDQGVTPHVMAMVFELTLEEAKRFSGAA